MDKIKVIQCYTGDVAKRQIRLVLDHPRLELVGVLVFNEDKVGLDAGDIAGLDKTGVIATNRIEDILAIDADVALYNSVVEQYDDVIALLASGKNVLQIKGGYHPKELPEYEALEEACRKGNTSFMSTGVNPGYAPEVLPMVASALCSKVDHMHIFAGGNLSNRPAMELSFMGFGGPEDQLSTDMYKDLYEGAVRSTAAALSLTLDEVIGETEIGVASKTFEKPLLVEEGTVAGIRYSLIGLVAGERRVTLEITWFLDREGVHDSWLRGARSDGWTIKVSGQPDITLSLDVGQCDEDWVTDLTAARVINDIPIVCNAEPGTMTLLDAPTPRVW